MRIFIIILSLFIFNQSFAQHGQRRGKRPKSMGQISGQVIDGETKKSMEYVSVAIYKDDALIKGVVTEKGGEFVVKELPLGTYKVEFNFIGYKAIIKEGIVLTKNESEIDLGKIVFKTEGEILETIEVVGEKAKVKYELDKKVINVENLNSVASETAIEILESVPSITIDIDGNVSLRGSSNFALLIDGQPSTLDVTDALRTIPASTIKDIEIITNPSAKYDAEGTSGFINIILKRNRLKGISALVNANVGNFNNYGIDGNISWTEKKFAANLNGNYKNMNRPADLTSSRKTINNGDVFIIDSDGVFNRNMTLGHLTGEFVYNPNRKNTITVSGTIRKFEMNTSLDLNFDQKLNGTNIKKSITKEATDRDYHSSKIFAEYKYLFNANKKHYIKAQAFFNTFDGVEDAQTNYLYQETNVQYGGNKNLEVGPSDFNRYNLDYSWTGKNKAKLELGAQAQFGISQDDTNASKFDSTLQLFIPNDLLSTDVKYTRDILAGYAIYAHHYKKLKYQVGLRAEQTVRDVQIEQAAPTKQVNRIDYFPSAHFSYQWDNGVQTMASYSRRIDRPRSWYFEPFLTYRDEFNVRRGNPNLLPEYVDSYEVGFVKEFKKGSFSTELYHRKTHNFIRRIKSVYEPSVILTTYSNVGLEFSTGLEIDFNYKIAKFWRSQISTNLFNYKLEGDVNGEVFDSESNSYTLRWNNNFNFKRDYKFQLTSTYDSEIVTAQGTKSPSFSLNASLKKFFFDKKLGVTLQARNILGTAKRESHSVGRGFEYDVLRKSKSPGLSISLSYKINNYKFRMTRSGNEEF